MPNNPDTSIATSNNNVVSNQENHHPKKTNKNVLLDLAPKPSNTTKSIDIKACDNLMS